MRLRPSKSASGKGYAYDFNLSWTAVTEYMRILELLKKAADELERAGIEDALPDAEMIIFHAAGMDRLEAYINNPDISGAVSGRIRRLLQRRIKGEPVQYIVGHINFLGLTIEVGRGVLIPRPETELLVQEAIKTVLSPQFTIQGSGNNVEHGTWDIEHFSVLDLCTGSGCIALALAKEFPRAEVIGSDVSAKALSFAKANARANSINNVRFIRGELFGPVKGRRFDIITANPPYIRTEEMGSLQREILDWEPEEALDGGLDGLDFYRSILSSAGIHLNPGGLIFLELGYDQADLVRQLADRKGFKDVSVVEDFSGIGRILKARSES